MLDSAKLVTPAQHGEILLIPPAQELAALAQVNARILKNVRATLHGVPLYVVREQTRRHVLSTGDRGPIFVAGHQPEFIHAGVWAKYVAADVAAGVTGGTAVHMVVDSDALRQVALRVPRVEETTGAPGVVEVPIGHAKPGMLYEQLPALTRAEWATFAETVESAMGKSFAASQLPTFFQGVASQPEACDWVEQMTAGQRAIEQRFGVQVRDMRLSRVPMEALLREVIHQADRFAACYNAALADYRRTFGIRGNTRPIPDLVHEPDVCELPLWLVPPGGGRCRAYVRRERNRLTLLAEQQPICAWPPDELAGAEDGESLARACAPWVLRPRALMTTLWARLLLADFFFHGIGGARYDRITDGIIARYFGMSPPAYGCMSATLRMDLPRKPVHPAEPAALVHALHDARHNPQRHSEGVKLPPALLEEKQRLLALGAALRRQHPADRAARAEVFRALRHINETLGALTNAAGDIRRQIEEVRRALAWNRIADDREYFFGMLSDEALASLVAHIRDMPGFKGCYSAH